MMQQGWIKYLPLALISFFSQTVIAGPWFTGPILAPAGHTIPRGHSNLETYAFFTNVSGVYNSFGKVTHTPGGISDTGNPLFSHGLTDTLDIQFSLPYTYNSNMGQHSHHLSDVGATLGYQLLEQKDSRWVPDLRVTLQEIVPTGRFKDLSPIDNGTDATGLGSYQTAVNLNFQHLLPVGETHYLRTRLSVGYVYADNVPVDGFSTYGGAANTVGNVSPGNMITADLAAEFTLTQNWVVVMETYLSKRQATKFRGFPGRNPDGSFAVVGHGVTGQTTLAPAIEYNFNSNIGIIAGPWFTVRGRDTADFMSYVVALNAYW